MTMTRIRLEYEEFLRVAEKHAKACGISKSELSALFVEVQLKDAA